MIWTDNNNETNKFEAERRAELSIPMQELVAGISRIRAARSNVEVSISDVVARLATKEYNEKVAKDKAVAEAQAVQAAHEYPLVTEAEAKPEADLLHDDELDADEIRARLDAMMESQEDER